MPSVGRPNNNGQSLLPDALVDYLDASPLPVLAFLSPTTSPLRVQYANPAALHFLHVRHDRDLLDAFDHADHPKLEEYLRRPTVDEAIELSLDDVPSTWKAHHRKDYITLTAQHVPAQGQLAQSTTSPRLVRPKLTKRSSRSSSVDTGYSTPSSHTPLILEEAEDFLRVSKNIAVGLAKFSLEGEVLWVNPAWLRITGIEGTPEALANWPEKLHPDDRDRVLQAYAVGVAAGSSFDLEWRWSNGNYCHVTSGLDHKDRDKATGWIGTVVDITAQENAKMAMVAMANERTEIARAAAQEAEDKRKVAEEEKRQQELLIDISSHEMRNPVSAIQQNAEITRESLEELQAILGRLERDHLLPKELAASREALREDIEAMDAIFECASLQGRIANDILGLAQIQLQRFTITPVPFELLTSLRTILKMFRSECKSHDITLELEIGHTMHRLGRPRHCLVTADPTRLGQILINLLSNAIRFTTKSAVRKVTLSLDVSQHAPEKEEAIVPPNDSNDQIHKASPIFLFFSVHDTGPGLTADEIRIIFGKFQQASPMTHTSAGGSGLGLWIARSLCELQGGRIEAVSQVGQGSTFRCFISARSVDSGPEPDFSVPPVAVVENIVDPRHLKSSSPSRRTFSDGAHAPAQSTSMDVDVEMKTTVSKLAEDSMEAEGTKQRKLNLLVCEDNALNAKVLKRQLVKAGHVVELADDGKVGYAKFLAHATSFDAIIMDVEMPEMNGLECTRRIRAFEKASSAKAASVGLGSKKPIRVRIIGLTGNARRQQLDNCLDAGMDTVLTKPYRINELLAELQHDSAMTAPKTGPGGSDATSMRLD